MDVLRAKNVCFVVNKESWQNLDRCQRFRENCCLINFNGHKYFIMKNYKNNLVTLVAMFLFPDVARWSQPHKKAERKDC